MNFPIDSWIFFFKDLFLSSFLYLERERERESWGGTERGERESQAGCVLSAPSQMRGSNSRTGDRDLGRNQELDA